MKYYIIGDEDAVLGFGMVGVKGSIVETSDQARQAFQDVLEDREVGIIIITERAAELIRPLIKKYVFTERFPLIVEVPDRRGPVPGKPGIRETVNQAVGISI
ncbi:MAG: V-type ATP synthase subunit F [Spirochaetota bacterium]